ncbi:c-type cytochrome [Mesorhizobium mediterraneum]|uniref:Cytochrome C n=1 Tax=Mesorhizobium mediterraneum TaxID=43617 RepID=A0AB36R873_9HYPH|nr:MULTISPECIES: c-type cytochrome [Mesorhizobium]RWN40999.1 MAG: cytochrome C [Mesorhizobium sp.]PAQ00969.1 cytochrome C [Mesorhizobium mediterraneum]RUU44374.1 cytochrome C [Mesorhizobium sp. M6A.T.Ce.TU.002.03.1.1]TIU14366.1 MAG: cytochrome C [Mesorhizobium sp.]WIW52245.1 c-type cytochrome [Mesorhizobium mediterraneum]
MSPWLIPSVVVFTVAAGFGAPSQAELAAGKFYEVVGAKVDARTYNGFRRYHGSCNHCHGPDGMGSTFASALVDRLPTIEVFRRNVRDGVRIGPSVMKGFADDPNVAPYIDDIYAYLQARADGALGRGRPERLEN